MEMPELPHPSTCTPLTTPTERPAMDRQHAHSPDSHELLADLDFLLLESERCSTALHSLLTSIESDALRSITLRVADELDSALCRIRQVNGKLSAASLAE